MLAVELLTVAMIEEDDEEDVVTVELEPTAVWDASEFSIALSKVDGSHVVSKLEYPGNARPKI